jgi:hypothetical protein
MSDANANPPAQAGTPIWVWIAVAAVVVLVAVGGGYWFMKGHHKTAVAVKGHALLGALGSTVTDLDTTVPDADKMCSVALTRAMDFGVAPQGSTLVSQDAEATQPEGTFVCHAQTSDGQYTLGISTICRGSQEKTCFALDAVKRGDGQVIYRREG